MLATKNLVSIIIATTALIFASINIATAAEPQCDVDRTINFGGMSWESNLVLTDVQRFILEHGYGCQTDVLPTETIPALAALERGDLDVNTEIWLNSMGSIWDDAEKRGRVIRSTHLFQGGEGWFIPKYVQERFPDLKSVADLPKYKDEFQDPESPDKGRFYGCPAGWSCEILSTNLFKAYHLGDSFVYYQPGTGAAQKAAIMSEYRRQNNIVFYYWLPTPLVGSLDLVRLELPEYDEEKYQCLSDPECVNPEPSDYPDTPIFTALNKKFAEEAPTLKAFFDSNKVPIEAINAALAEMEESGDESMEVAKWFLKQYPEVWTEWVPDDVAERVQAAL
ncbi:Glycine betaine-binding periplasmic protein precursor [Oligella ureolytica]|uniref:ABC transporter substrate-binding protein n=1 Tax=Oligella ureolytica TaxID=90244 RepID=A0A378XH98_9BURK|nr:ABC transporter substrate-binding protein [Oligella ureolytica]QPT39032.1 ABC transporter substrate-binding protein [Oligella ureolytica]SUA54556.1 Glycine betaine-binding periplasmic protein precursor [Oligella ureolytica]